MSKPSHPANPFFKAQLAQLETLRYRVHATTTLTGEDREVAVMVTVLVTDGLAEASAVLASVQTALRHFIATEWAVTLLDRVPDAPGFVQVLLRATARLAPVERSKLADLEARAKAAGREGLRLSHLTVTAAHSPARLSTAVTTLREETLAEIERHIAGISLLSGRRWRIGNLHFGTDTENREHPRPARRRPSGDGGTAPAADADPAGADRVVLVTEVMLKAESLTVH